MDHIRIAIIVLLTLSIAGCSTPHTNRLETLNQKIDAAGILLRDAQNAGDQVKVLAVNEELEALRKERESVSAMAREEANNRQMLLLTILGIVTGGLKLAADKFGKVTA